MGIVGRVRCFCHHLPGGDKQRGCSQSGQLRALSSDVIIILRGKQPADLNPHGRRRAAPPETSELESRMVCSMACDAVELRLQRKMLMVDPRA
jgi:hypothetical protein